MPLVPSPCVAPRADARALPSGRNVAAPNRPGEGSPLAYLAIRTPVMSDGCTSHWK